MQCICIQVFSGHFFDPPPSSSFSLGCSAAAPGSAGGCCAAAKAGTTEVQHGQRSAWRGKCEKWWFPFDTLKYFTCLTHGCRFMWEQYSTHTSRCCICLQAELKHKLSERNKLLSEYEVESFIIYTSMHSLDTYMRVQTPVIHLSCHNSSNSGGRTEYCSSSSKSSMKLNIKHMKSASDGWGSWHVSSISTIYVWMQMTCHKAAHSNQQILK